MALLMGSEWGQKGAPPMTKKATLGKPIGTPRRGVKGSLIYVYPPTFFLLKYSRQPQRENLNGTLSEEMQVNQESYVFVFVEV